MGSFGKSMRNGVAGLFSLATTMTGAVAGDRLPDWYTPTSDAVLDSIDRYAHANNLSQFETVGLAVRTSPYRGKATTYSSVPDGCEVMAVPDPVVQKHGLRGVAAVICLREEEEVVVRRRHARPSSNLFGCRRSDGYRPVFAPFGGFDGRGNYREPGVYQKKGQLCL